VSAPYTESKKSVREKPPACTAKQRLIIFWKWSGLGVIFLILIGLFIFLNWRILSFLLIQYLDSVGYLKTSRGDSSELMGIFSAIGKVLFHALVWLAAIACSIFFGGLAWALRLRRLLISVAEEEGRQKKPLE